METRVIVVLIKLRYLEYLHLEKRSFHITDCSFSCAANNRAISSFQLITNYQLIIVTMKQGLRVDYLFLLNLMMTVKKVNNKCSTLHLHSLSLSLENVFF